MNRRKIYYFWGTYFIFVQLVVILRNHIVNYDLFFWYCDFSPLLLGIFLILNKPKIVKGITYFGFFPQLAFLTGFFLQVVSPLNFAIPNEGFILNFLTILLHFSTPLAFLLVSEVKPTKHTLIYSAIFIFLVYLVTIFFVDGSSSINYVYRLGPFYDYYSIPGQVYIWPFVSFFFLIISTYFFDKFFHKLRS